MNKWLISTVMAGLISAGVQAGDVATDSYKQMRKEISIMSNILNSTLKEQDNKQFRSGRVEATYLKNQGIVFNISTSSKRMSFGDINIVVPDFSAIREVAPVIAPEDWAAGRVSEEEVERVTEQAMRAYEQIAEGSREMAEYQRELAEEARELRDQQRELARDIRDIERRKRDLEFELRHADEKHKQKISQKLKALEEKQAKYKEEERRFSQDATSITSKLKADKLERHKRTQQARTAFYQQVEQSISETMCDYGAGLKSLDKGENVTFVLENAGPKSRKGVMDKIYVFKKKDISACVAGKLKAQGLIDKSQNYFF